MSSSSKCFLYTRQLPTSTVICPPCISLICPLYVLLIIYIFSIFILSYLWVMSFTFQICSSMARMGLQAPIVGVGIALPWPRVFLPFALTQLFSLCPPILTVLAFVSTSLKLRHIQSCLCCCCCSNIETGSCCVAQASLELMILCGSLNTKSFQ